YIMSKSIIKEFLGNELFANVLVVGLDGKLVAYNKLPEPGEVETMLNNYKKQKKFESIKLMGENYNIYVKDKSKVFGHSDTKGCIVVRANKVFIVGIFPKKQDVSPRLSCLDHYSQLFDSQIEPI
ncbi:hypothetical protein SAMD00019534_064040, partial [Acytostelium subglobosum LB1]|uniref:hypothetical protein n=1 Tax=Acytostelium subglobosum LB1 TaxID=1410327 RepID=UPI000644EEA4